MPTGGFGGPGGAELAGVRVFRVSFAADRGASPPDRPGVGARLRKPLMGDGHG